VEPRQRLLWVQAPDTGDFVVGIPDGGRKLEVGLALAVAPSARLEITEIGPQGWERTLKLLRTQRGDLANVDFLLTSVSSELTDPSHEPLECLIDLARFVQDEHSGRLAVLNASSLVPRSPRGDDSTVRKAEALSLRIRQLNLVCMEASNATGLSVVDADQLVAEKTLPGKIIGPFDYSPQMCEALQSRFVSILHELGFAERSVMEARVPFVRQAGQLTIERWLKSEGDLVTIEDAICEIRLGDIRRMSRPTSALVLASIRGRTPRLRTLLSRERVRQRTRDATLALVAGETAILRKILSPVGAGVRSLDAVALLTADRETPIGDASATRGQFRTAMRSTDARIEILL
jgi:hypothetical protein